MIYKGKEGDHADKPKLSEIPRPEWADTFIFSPKYFKKYGKNFQIDMPIAISAALKGVSFSWGQSNPQPKDQRPTTHNPSNSTLKFIVRQTL